jgi:bifunctional NMN adenylyltransferase/nudix hydrolase
VKIFLNKFAITDAYKQLQSELKFVRNYKKQWAVSPYPVKHATVDSVVEQSGHILLVKRKAEPGKGLWALPGGHLNEFEKQLDGAIRELREETKIKVPEAVLRGSIRDHETFDDPYRSTLGRVITKAYHFKLADDVTLPKVKGADDAEKAKWVPISELREEDFFDDHYFIIQYFLGL